MLKYHTSGIYYIICKANDKIYIGQTKRITLRWNSHKSTLNKNKHHNLSLQQDYNLYGSEIFEYKILEICPSEILDERERFWINQYKDKLYNILSGGKKNFKHSKESKQKISKALKGIIHSEEHMRKFREARKGKKLSDETKLKISETNKKLGIKPPNREGGKHTNEWKLKMSIRLKDKSRSEEWGHKISESHKGKKLSEETKRKISESQKARQKVG
jgi:group I intron endonuclease